jgi:hypothetical protein
MSPAVFEGRPVLGPLNATFLFILMVQRGWICVPKSGIPKFFADCTKVVLWGIYAMHSRCVFFSKMAFASQSAGVFEVILAIGDNSGQGLRRRGLDGRNICSSRFLIGSLQTHLLTL